MVLDVFRCSDLSQVQDADDTSHVPECSTEQSHDQESEHDDSTDHDNSGDSPQGPPTGMIELPRPDGLSTAAVVAILRQPPSSGDVLPRIPAGVKNNVYCVVDNSGNNERRRRGHNSIFDDDCGVWLSDKNRSTLFPYVCDEDGTLRRIFWIASKGAYCREVKVDGSRVYQPLSPQPVASSVITLRRYYVTLAANQSYKRRVTLLANASASLAVVEYFGEHVTGAPHGGNKNPQNVAPYVRTAAVTMDTVAEEIQKLPTQAAYNKLVQYMDPDLAPRDSAVVRNKKKRDAKQRRDDAGVQHCANFADEVQAVIGMAQCGPFVRTVEVTRHRVPNVIVYTDRQINDLKGFCFGGKEGSVLAFDKTYNLGSIYVTPSVYKNLALCRRRTNDNPLFMGPIFVHGHSDFAAYAYFFSHMSACVVACNQQQLTIGSDDEAAMRKAMQHAFPSASFVVCSRHLKENLIRKVDAVLGSRTAQRRALIDGLFGSEGANACTDVVSFDEAVRKYRQSVLSAAPADIASYVDSRIISMLRLNVVASRSAWTNNNCESVNHILKQSVQWRPQQLPDLIGKLSDLVWAQFVEADRAMCGRGDFFLSPTHAKHRLTVDAWKSMSAAQRSKATQACFKLASIPPVTSTDGGISVPLTPGAGKKPLQRKRKIAEKSTSVNKAPKVADASDSDFE